MVIFGVNFGGALEFKPHILSLIIGLRGMGHRHPWARTLSSETVLCAGFPTASGSFLMSQLFTSGGQNIGVNIIAHIFSRRAL